MPGSDIDWPRLETRYEDESGPVDPEVHRAAGELWPRARRMANDLLGDPATGYGLLQRAVSAVSRLTLHERGRIRDVVPYLFKTYKRLVLAEVEKVNGHRLKQIEAAELWHSAGADPARSLDRGLLVQELAARLDPWARHVFELLVLGYSFDEIGPLVNRNPHVARNRFRLAVRRVAKQIGVAGGKASAPRRREDRSTGRGEVAAGAAGTRDASVPSGPLKDKRSGVPMTPARLSPG
jgi:DNA-directed RNA polymerase specialized sigma24 family protein